MSDIQVKAIGELMKVSLVEFSGLDDFFNKAKDENWILEDILDEWNSIEKNILLLPAKQFASQFNMIQDNLPPAIEFKNDVLDDVFYFLQPKAVLEVEGIKNAAELSGEGKIITSYDLKFNNFEKRYLRIPESNFFSIEPDQIILNQIRLIQDGTTQTLGLKLTGKAAEIAARRGV